MNYEIADNHVMIEEDDEIKTYEIIACIPINDKKFLIYTDGTQDNNGNISLYMNSIEQRENGLVLGNTTDEEFQAIINTLKERMSE